MPSESGIRLLNCTACDDIVCIQDERTRSCLCGKSQAHWDGSIGAHHLTGPHRVLVIPWEEYDGARPGEHKTWFVKK
jgi:hypothetical protein